MNENNIISAILTVAFYTARGGAMSLPQIIATYREMQNILGEGEESKTKSKRSR